MVGALSITRAGILILAVALLLFSPPILEWLRYSTVTELAGMGLVLASLYFRKTRQGFSMSFGVLALLAKEPLGLFLPLAEALEKRLKKAAALFVFASIYILYFFAHSRNKYYNITTLDLSWVQRIALKAAFDTLSSFGLVLIFLKTVGFNFKRMLKERWQSMLVFFAGALMYAVVITPKALGWGFHYSPVVVLFNLALTTNLKREYLKATPATMPRNVAIAVLTVLVALLPARLIWNLNKLKEIQAECKEIFASIRESLINGALGSNCSFDVAGIGFGADRRKDLEQCYAGDSSIVKCCQEAALYLLHDRCPNADRREAEAKLWKEKVLVERPAWKLIKCH